MNDALFGHEAEAHEFLSAMRGDRPHHGWLFVGPEGVGKASSALAFARLALAESSGIPVPGEGWAVPDDHPTARYMASHAHPDFYLLERLPKDEKLHGKPRTDWPDKPELARSIKVDQVRALTARFATKPSLSERRIVVIDAADHLEVASANALLKVLEEPPQGTIFILISHAPGRLLPTIRSRCRVLRFAPLGDDAMTQALRAALPEASADELASLVRSGAGAPGQALQFAGLGLGELTQQIETLTQAGDPGLALRSTLAQSLAGKAAQEKYEAFLSLVPAHLAGLARQASVGELPKVIAAWEKARDLCQMAIPGSYDAYMIVMELGSLLASLAPERRHAKA
jgi:DNA polymerase-3 subunit delta'